MRVLLLAVVLLVAPGCYGGSHWDPDACKFPKSSVELRLEGFVEDATAARFVRTPYIGTSLSCVAPESYDDLRPAGNGTLAGTIWVTNWAEIQVEFPGNDLRIAANYSLADITQVRLTNDTELRLTVDSLPLQVTRWEWWDPDTMRPFEVYVDARSGAGRIEVPVNSSWNPDLYYRVSLTVGTGNVTVQLEDPAGAIHRKDVVNDAEPNLRVREPVPAAGRWVIAVQPSVPDLVWDAHASIRYG